MQKSFYDVGISPFGPGFHAAPVPSGVSQGPRSR